jgi:hypothetical protein
LFTFASFLKIAEVAHFLLLVFSTVRVAH